jgi:putative acetyltransferase
MFTMSQPTTQIRPETLADCKAIWNLNQAAFESRAEADLVDALRAGGFVAASLVADEAGETIGHILFSRLVIHSASGAVAALALAPMAVHPSRQRRGVGSQLVTEGLATCRKLGHRIVTVLGHPGFYSRFGFSADLACPLISPFGDGEAWMALELVPGSLRNVSGRVEYALPFLALKQEG